MAVCAVQFHDKVGVIKEGLALKTKNAVLGIVPGSLSGCVVTERPKFVCSLFYAYSKL
jgi:hypothetical protein